MKVIIAGSRTITWEAFIEMWTLLPNKVATSITEVVSGAAKGPDKHGEVVAKHNKIPIAQFPAIWGVHGKRAGILRNMDMGNYADAAILFWDGESRGTEHMKEFMIGLDKPVIVITRKENEQESSITYYGEWNTLPARDPTDSAS